MAQTPLQKKYEPQKEKNKQHTPEQNKWDCHLIAPNYHFDKWKSIKAGKQMAPRAPPAPLSPLRRNKEI